MFTKNTLLISFPYKTPPISFPAYGPGRHSNTHTHTHPINGPLSETTRVSRYHKFKTNLDFTEARDSEWQWNPLGHMQVCTSLQTDNHASTPPLSFLQAGCPFCRPANSVKALKAIAKHLPGTYLLSYLPCEPRNRVKSGPDM